jgi:HEAT repeat protein
MARALPAARSRPRRTRTAATLAYGPGVVEPDRRRAVLSGHRGDEEEARSLLGHADPEVRAAALGALARMGRMGARDVSGALHDESPAVRRRACEVAGPEAAADLLAVLTADADATVVEAAAWALGEGGPAASAAGAVPVLARVATDHPDALCREAAVAALGAIGDPDGLPAILRATTDRPAVRRRAVIALAPFEGPEVEDALQRARNDRDWQVRQAAEDLS